MATVYELIHQARTQVADLLPEEIPNVVGEIEFMKCQLGLRMGFFSSPGPHGCPDSLLTAQEASSVLKISKDTLYRNRWAFEVQVSKGSIRYSERGIQDYIRRKMGR